jgi:hypothetical protein
MYLRRGKRAIRAAAERLKSASCASNQHPRRISLSAVRLRLFLHFAQQTPVATTLCSCMIAGESAGLKHVKRNPPHRVLLTTDITLHPLTNATDLSTRCQGNLPAGFQWSLRLELSSTLLFLQGDSICRCHRRVFLLRPDAVVTYHRMCALGLSRP